MEPSPTAQIDLSEEILFKLHQIEQSTECDGATIVDSVMHIGLQQLMDDRDELEDTHPDNSSITQS